MTDKKSDTVKEFTVLVSNDRKNKVQVYVSSDKRKLITEELEKNSDIIYFEKFRDEAKAMRRKKFLSGLSRPELIRLIKKKNPELLNLIFVISGNYC